MCIRDSFYRVYFKLLSSQLNPKCILNASSDETMLLKSESDDVTTLTPKLLKWNEITLSEVFIIQNTRPPRNIAQKNIQQIIEEPDGRVLIGFYSSKGFNSSKERSLSSKSLENLELPRTSYSMPCRSASYDYPKDNQVEDTQKIYYKAPIAEPIDEATSSIGSPTYSIIFLHKCYFNTL